MADKKQPVKKRNITQLLEIIGLYGCSSNECYIFIRPFIMKALNRYIGYQNYDECLVANAFMQFVQAMNGYEKIDKKTKACVFVPPYFDPDKCKNIGNFIWTISRNAVSKYKNEQKRYTINTGRLDSIEGNQHLDSDINRLEEEYYQMRFNDDSIDLLNIYNINFYNLKFNKLFLNHLRKIYANKPKNNLFYNYMSLELLDSI